MRGRKPAPHKLQVIDGGFRTRAGVSKPPTCPAHLNPTAKAEWKRLAWSLFDRGILGEGDRASLAGYCQSYGRWVEAEKKLAETPLLIKLPSGYIQQSPWLAIANKQLEIMAKYMSELGLSPVSRSRVTVRPSLSRKPWERASDVYLGRK
jgi:P27 family predicted phage terminase small subunit